MTLWKTHCKACHYESEFWDEKIVCCSHLHPELAEDLDKSTRKVRKPKGSTKTPLAT